VKPFKCEAVSAITTYGGSAEAEVISIEKGGDAKLIKEEAEVRAWFKIDKVETSKKAECEHQVKFKLEKKGSLSYTTVENDPLVSVTETGQLEITKDEATLVGKDYYVTAYTDAEGDKKVAPSRKLITI
jgi:hypothetical protein